MFSFIKYLFLLSLLCFSGALLCENPSQNNPKQIEHSENPPILEDWDSANKGLEEAQNQHIRETWAKMVYTLVGIVFCLFLAVWMFKRLSPGTFRTNKGTSAIKIIERIGISPKTSITLISINKKTFIVCESQVTTTIFPEMTQNEIKEKN